MRMALLVLTILSATCAGLRAAIPTGGVVGDDTMSLIYNSADGNLKLDAAGKQLTALEIISQSAYFDYELPCPPLAFCDTTTKFFVVAPGGFGDMDFGPILPAGLEAETLAKQFVVNGALAAGGGVGKVDLVYVPEPSSFVLLVLGALSGIGRSQRSRRGW